MKTKKGKKKNTPGNTTGFNVDRALRDLVDEREAIEGTIAAVLKLRRLRHTKQGRPPKAIMRAQAAIASAIRAPKVAAAAN